MLLGLGEKENKICGRKENNNKKAKPIRDKRGPERERERDWLPYLNGKIKPNSCPLRVRY